MSFTVSAAVPCIGEFTASRICSRTLQVLHLIMQVSVDVIRRIVIRVGNTISAIITSSFLCIDCSLLCTKGPQLPLVMLYSCQSRSLSSSRIGRYGICNTCLGSCSHSILYAYIPLVRPIWHLLPGWIFIHHSRYGMPQDLDGLLSSVGISL